MTTPATTPAPPKKQHYALKGEEACVHSCEDRSCKKCAGNLLWQKEGHPVWTHQKCASKHPNCTVQCLGWTWLERPMTTPATTPVPPKKQHYALKGEEACVHKNRAGNLLWQNPVWTHQKCASKHPDCTVQCLGWTWLERAKGGSQMLCSSCNSARILVECVHTCERRKCPKSSRSLHRHQQLTSKHPNCTSQCPGWAYRFAPILTQGSKNKTQCPISRRNDLCNPGMYVSLPHML